MYCVYVHYMFIVCSMLYIIFLYFCFTYKSNYIRYIKYLTGHCTFLIVIHYKQYITVNNICMYIYIYKLYIHIFIPSSTYLLRQVAPSVTCETGSQTEFSERSSDVEVGTMTNCVGIIGLEPLKNTLAPLE